MIRRSELEQTVSNALVMNLGDLGAHAGSIIAEARQHAEEILREANEQRTRLLADAGEEARRVGHAEGLAQGRAEGHEAGLAEARQAQIKVIEQLCATWGEALDRFEGDRETLLLAARTEVVALAAEIASRVLRRVIELDPASVVAQLEAVLSTVAEPSRLVMRVHPEDLAIARAELPDLISRFEQCTHAELVADPGLARGSCTATTDGGGRIDAEIGAQLERIVRDLLPQGESLRLDRPAAGDAA